MKRVKKSGGDVGGGGRRGKGAVVGEGRIGRARRGDWSGEIRVLPRRYDV